MAIKKTAFSTKLIAVGCVLVLIAIAAEAIAYPWVSYTSHTSEDALPDPPPPAFETYSYAEYLEIISVTPQEEPSVDIVAALDVLPSPDAPPPAEGEAEHDVPQDEPPEEEVEEAPCEIEAYIQKFVWLGSVKIPRINVSENLFLGTASQVNYGIGHLEGTPMAGQEGNAVIAGHRVSTVNKQPFRYIDKLENGDVVIVSLGDEVFTYEVYDRFIVSEHAMWVLYPDANETHVLTLVTCDPVVTVTRRDNRLIVRARLVD